MNKIERKNYYKRERERERTILDLYVKRRAEKEVKLVPKKLKLSIVFFLSLSFLCDTQVGRDQSYL